VGLGWLGLGCYPTVSTAGGSALVHTHFPYAVTYQDENTKSVLGEDWLLENYRIGHEQNDGSLTSANGSSALMNSSLASADGSPAARDGSLTLLRKEGYTFKYEFDFDDDDKTDATEQLPAPDLLLLHRKTNARLVVSTVLLDKRYADKELRVLLNNIVDNDSGTQSLFVGFGRVGLGVQKRYASKLIDSSEATLGGTKGLVATIERADVDQLQLNANARWRRARVFMMHLPFDYYVQGVPNGTLALAADHKYGVLLLVEYTNTPEDFEAQYPDFLRLMNATHVLTDDMLLEYVGKPLAKCGNNPGRTTLSVWISALGAPSVQDAGELDSICASGVISSYRFAGGEKRKVEHRYDFSKSLRPAWLDAGGYQEQRVKEAPVKEAPVKEVPVAEAAKPAAEGSPPPTEAPAATPSVGTDPAGTAAPAVNEPPSVP